MSVTMVSRWKGKEDHTPLLKEEAPFLRRHGAISIRCGRRFAGSYAGARGFAPQVDAAGISSSTNVRLTRQKLSPFQRLPYYGRFPRIKIACQQIRGIPFACSSTPRTCWTSRCSSVGRPIQASLARRAGARPHHSIN